MAVVSIVLLSFSGLFVALGIIPCFGCLNWVGVPLSALTVTVGLVGLFGQREQPEQRSVDLVFHAFAVGMGSLLVLVGAVRCLLGGCIL